MSKKRRSSDGPSPLKIEMTPMIDVVFQLLIFFMCATKFKTMEGRLDAFLPKDTGNAPGPQTEFNSIIVDIDSDGSLAVNGTKCRGQKAFYDQLKRLKAIIAKPKVIVNPHAKVQHKFVMSTLDICRKIGLAEVAFRAPNPPNEHRRKGT
jgi:biopolymer transport protein ExbD